LLGVFYLTKSLKGIILVEIFPIYKLKIFKKMSKEKKGQSSDAKNAPKLFFVITKNELSNFIVKTLNILGIPGSQSGYCFVEPPFDITIKSPSRKIIVIINVNELWQISPVIHCFWLTDGKYHEITQVSFCKERKDLDVFLKKLTERVEK
jgi:hypothetical protein